MVLARASIGTGFKQLPVFIKRDCVPYLKLTRKGRFLGIPCQAVEGAADDHIIPGSHFLFENSFVRLPFKKDQVIPEIF